MRYCAATRESDSEEMESPHGVDARTQLILSNSKGPVATLYSPLLFPFNVIFDLPKGTIELPAYNLRTRWESEGAVRGEK